MPAIEPLCQQIGMNVNKFSKLELLIFETEIFMSICEEIKIIIIDKNRNYFRLTKTYLNREETMLDASVIQYIINDLLVTEDYSFTGIAYYTQTPEEVLCDVASGKNTAPSLPLSRKLIELHRTVKPEFYREIIKKIISYYCTENQDSQWMDELLRKFN